MPLILSIENARGTRDVMIVLGPENLARIKEKDPLVVKWWEFPFADQKPGQIGISYATDAELTQMTQLARQGKTGEAIEMAMRGWKYRPELGDNDLPPTRYS
jgi:hypothetical protein